MFSVCTAASVLALATGASAEPNASSGFRASGSSCPLAPAVPPAPRLATDLNGIAWPELCLEPQAGNQEEHFFIIGDWGGIFQGPFRPPETANNAHRRPYLSTVDPHAQILVAAQMKMRARASKPRYVINVGDNFYWDGVNTECGHPTDSIVPSTLAQWEAAFEAVYDGPDLMGKVWMGVLGNHDFGGYKFTTGWDQAIAYSWAPEGRWLTPALYWSRRVTHPGFSVDYVFMDSNVNDAFPPGDLPGHNICSRKNNAADATCGETGPVSPDDCVTWFHNLWDAQIPWAEERLGASDADWRIIVTHFPPDFRSDVWQRFSELYKVDLIITGHRHQQEIHLPGPSNVIGETAWVVSGGGGGITAEQTPHEDGDDDAYGFMDVAIQKDRMRIESISHGGVVRMSVELVARNFRTTSTITTTTITTTQTSTTTITATTSATSTSTTERSMGFRDRPGADSGYFNAARPARASSWIFGLLLVVSGIGLEFVL